MSDSAIILEGIPAGGKTTAAHNLIEAYRNIGKPAPVYKHETIDDDRSMSGYLARIDALRAPLTLLDRFIIGPAFVWSIIRDEPPPLTQEQALELLNIMGLRFDLTIALFLPPPHVALARGMQRRHPGHRFWGDRDITVDEATHRAHTLYCKAGEELIKHNHKLKIIHE